MSPHTRAGEGKRTTLSRAIAKRIRFVGFDVDGVLTEGGIFIGDVNGAPLEFKRFDIQDGVGIKLLQRAGIVTAIITGRVSESVRIRGRELGIPHVVQDPDALKLPALERILREERISLAEAAFIGDDLPDVPLLRVVGLPVVVGNATDEAARSAKLRLERPGGHGAVREFVELLLRARGQWQHVVDQYLAPRMVRSKP